MPKSSFDKNMEKVSAEFDRVADDVKDTAEDIGNRWTRSTTEEKITMIVGIVFLVRALIKLKTIQINFLKSFNFIYRLKNLNIAGILLIHSIFNLTLNCQRTILSTIQEVHVL